MTDEDEIRGVLERYERALDTGDSDLAESCYEADAVIMPTTLPTVRGTAIRGWYENFFKATKMDVRFTVDEVVVASGSVAYAMTRSHGTQTALARGTQSPESNREIFIFTRDSEAWKIARYMFNKPE
jgi:ketosteroid isomerase-like protein